MRVLLERKYYKSATELRNGVALTIFNRWIFGGDEGNFALSR